MLSFTRRITTTAIAVALAGSALATTGPAAFAGKPGSEQPISIDVSATVLPLAASPHVDIDYRVPAKSASSVTCTLDGVSLSECYNPGFGRYVKDITAIAYLKRFAIAGDAVPAEHTFAVTVKAGSKTYTGSTTFTAAL